MNMTDLWSTVYNSRMSGRHSWTVQEARLGSTSAIYWIGTLLSALIAAWTYNRSDRRVGICVGIFLVTVGILLQSEEPNYTVFKVARFIIGKSSSFINNTAPLLFHETFYPKEHHRLSEHSLYQKNPRKYRTISFELCVRIRQSSICWKVPQLLV